MTDVASTKNQMKVIIIWLVLLVYSYSGAYYENLEFYEIITDEVPFSVSSPSDVQICNYEGYLAVWTSDPQSSKVVSPNLVRSGSLPTNKLMVFDCTAPTDQLRYVLFQDNQIYVSISDPIPVRYQLSLTGLIGSAGEKACAIGWNASQIYYFPIDYGFYHKAQMDTLDGTVYGVRSSSEIYSAAHVRIDGTTAIVKFYGFNSSNPAIFPVNGRADYLPKDFTFPIDTAISDMRFLVYDNILYYAYQNYLDETFIQAIPSNQSGSYKIGGNNNKLISYNMIAMGSDRTTLLLAYIYLTGDVWIGLWDATSTVGFATKDLGISVNTSSLRNEPLGFYRGNDTYAELYLAADGMVRAFGLTVIEKTQQAVIVIDILEVSTSTTVVDLVLNGSSTVVINEGSILTITGCATLNGTLVIVLSNGTIAQILNDGTIELPVINLACRNGDFNDIVVKTDYNLPGCDEWNAKPNYSPTQLTLTVSIDKCPDDNTNIPGVDYTGLIIGVVIGGVALIVGILLLSFYFSPLRAKVFPYARSN